MTQSPRSLRKQFETYGFQGLETFDAVVVPVLANKSATVVEVKRACEAAALSARTREQAIATQDGVKRLLDFVNERPEDVFDGETKERITMVYAMCQRPLNPRHAYAKLIAKQQLYQRKCLTRASYDARLLKAIKATFGL